MLNVEIASELPKQSSVSLRDIASRVRHAGIDRDFIRRRLLPASADRATAAALDFAVRLNRIFGWTPSDVLSGDISNLELSARLSASYKLPDRSSDSRVRTYTAYTHYLALLTLDATAHLPIKSIPTSAAAVRDAILEYGDTMDFKSALLLAWDSGIPVLALAEPGGFHAIVGRTGFGNVVVLKQQNRSASRWLFDLLHELRDTAEEPGESKRVYVDDGDAGDIESEKQANLFAGNVMLDGQAEALAEQCVDAANQNVAFLTRVVPAVAEKARVATGDLANYLAYRLSSQGIDWWSTASNLQPEGIDPWIIAREEFFARVDFGMLAPIDAQLLAQALTD